MRNSSGKICGLRLWYDLLNKLSKEKIIYTHCAVGYRSLRAAKILKKYGYDVRPLKPGYDELVKAGFPTEKGSDKAESKK